MISKKDNTVVIQGGVANLSTLTYGGFTEAASQEQILLIEENARVLNYVEGMLGKNIKIDIGGLIFLLEEVRTKNMLLFKDITQILYLIFIGVAIVL